MALLGIRAGRMKTFFSIIVGTGHMLADQGDSLPPWAQYGILGLILIGLLYTKTIVAGWTYQDARTELIALRAENKALTQQIIENQQVALPALQVASEAVQQAMPIIKDALRLRELQGNNKGQGDNGESG